MICPKDGKEGCQHRFEQMVNEDYIRCALCPDCKVEKRGGK